MTQARRRPARRRPAAVRPAAVRFAAPAASPHAGLAAALPSLSLLSLLSLSLLSLTLLSGCHSAFVDSTIRNQGPEIHLLELDYPSASFGTQTLAHGAEYHYRFKVQGSGVLTLQFEDKAGKTHIVTGPSVAQGQEGPLLITITPEERVTWTPHLTVSR